MKKKSIFIIRWLARLGSLFTITIFSLMLISELIEPTAVAPIRPAEIIGLFFFPGGVSLGFIFAWRREELGGALALLSLLAFYIWHFIGEGDFPAGPSFFLFTSPAILFLIAWWLDKPGRGRLVHLSGRPA